MTDADAAFERGAWFAFDVVLSWINTQTDQMIDKKHLYKAVMLMRPAEIATYQQEQGILE